MSIEITVALSLMCALLGAATGYAGHRRAARKEAADRGLSDGVVLTEIGYIKSGIDDIKRKQDAQEARHLEVISRLTAVEGAARQAHKRLDGLPGLRN